jgi:hypothetical protein
MRKNLVLGAAVLSCASMAGASENMDQGWSLRLPLQEQVVFKGQVNFDKAGHGPGAMMYPAPGLAGLLVAIATHATIVNATRDSQKTDIEIAADKVLQPFSDTLSRFKYRELLGNALTLRSEHNMGLMEQEAKASGWVMESAPVFYMTQDKSALILDNTIAVYKPGAPDKAAYQNTVRVVSTPRDGEDMVAYWQQDAGKALRDESARLVTMSLDIAMDQARTPDAAPTLVQRTIRYLEGKSEVIERAHLLQDRCDRALVRNLRGWLLSIPLKRPLASDCKPAS